MKDTIGKIIRFFLQFLVAVLWGVIILAIFFNIGRHYREVKSAESILPQSGYLVKISDSNIFVQESGPATGTPIILIHGTGSWSEIWRDTITPLAKDGYRVFAIDLPPFGYSTKLRGPEEFTRDKQAGRLLEVINNLKLQKVILIAHSVGSRPAVEAALKNSDRISKLILVAPALGYPASEDAQFQFQQNNPTKLISFVFESVPLRSALSSVYGTNPLFIKNLFKSFVYKKESITESRVEMIKQPMVIKGTTEAYGDWLENLTTAKDNSLAADFSNFKNLKMPVYLIWGDQDTITPLWAGEKLNKIIPDSHLSVIKNVGHMPYIENVGEFNRILIDILKK